MVRTVYVAVLIRWSQLLKAYGVSKFASAVVWSLKAAQGIVARVWVSESLCEPTRPLREYMTVGVGGSINKAHTCPLHLTRSHELPLPSFCFQPSLERWRCGGKPAWKFLCRFILAVHNLFQKNHITELLPTKILTTLLRAQNMFWSFLHHNEGIKSVETIFNVRVFVSNIRAVLILFYNKSLDWGLKTSTLALHSRVEPTNA